MRKNQIAGLINPASLLTPSNAALIYCQEAELPGDATPVLLTAEAHQKAADEALEEARGIEDGRLLL